MKKNCLATSVLAASLLAASAGAEENSAENTKDSGAEKAPAVGSLRKETRGEIKIFGELEPYFSHNFNVPSNGYTAQRGFDVRHSQLSIGNATLGISASYDFGSIKPSFTVKLQEGDTPRTYKLSDPSNGPVGPGIPNANTPLSYFQEAYLGAQYELGGHTLFTQAGLFTSSIGFEAFPVHMNWNLSRSNLFVGFPFEHVCLRQGFQPSDQTTLTAAVCNSWNGMADNNDYPSGSLQLDYQNAEKTVAGRFLFFGGPEPQKGIGGAIEDRMRFHYHSWLQWKASERLAFAIQADAGLQENNFGVSNWSAGALYVRLKLLEAGEFAWYAAVRGDLLHEQRAGNAQGEAGNTFFPSDTVGEATLTSDFRLGDNIAVMLECRVDAAETPLYFQKNVRGSGSAEDPYVPNSQTQATCTAGFSYTYEHLVKF